MFEFSRGHYDAAIAQLRSILAEEPSHFDAQLSLGMALYRQGDYAAAIAEGHKAQAMRPRDQLAHTNLSLFYLKAGEKATAEHHGLQARLAGWREDPEAKNQTTGDPDLQLARPKPPPSQFPDQPWKRNPKVGGSSAS